MTLEEKIEKTVAAFGMAPQLSSVLVGLSGGADSVALLHYLLERSRKTGAKVKVLHVNHGIRGENADRDENFCPQLCTAWDVPLQVVRVDVPALAQMHGMGMEEAARWVRYDAFYRAREKDPSILSIATAHNADDNVETVLFHLARGSGLDGLAGIAPVTPQGVIRPLIDCTKEEIIAYCQGNNIRYVEDETNQDTRYSRNHIRHSVMAPMRALNPDLASAVTRMCRTVREDAAYLRACAEEFCHRSVKNFSTDRHMLLSLPSPILTRVLMQMYEEFTGQSLSYVHVEALLSALRSERTDKDVDLPGDAVFSVARDLVCFHSKVTQTDFQYPLSMGENRFDDLKVTIFLSFEEKKPDYDENIYKLSTYQKINFDKIKGEVFIRQRRAGDRYFTKNMTKSVKRWMCDTHIPRWRRDSVPLFCDDDGIFYVRGMGLRDELKTVEGCRVLHMYLLEECPYGIHKK